MLNERFQVEDKTVDGRAVTRLFTRPPESKNQLVEEQASLKGGYKNTTVVGLISRMLKREYYGFEHSQVSKVKVRLYY